MTNEDAFEESVGRRAALDSLYEIGNRDEVIRQAQRILEDDPEDFGAHYYLCLALIDQQKFKDAAYHLEQIRIQEPEAVESFHAAVSLAIARKQWRQARKDVEAALAVYADASLFHFLAALIALSQGRHKEAVACNARARQLDPEDPDYIDLDLRLRGVDENRADQAWDRIHEYEEALELDPQNADLHEGMGDVYFDDLDDHANAERCYREALMLSPRDHKLQRQLFKAVAKRRLFYRFLSIPSRAWSWLGDVIRGLRFEPWRILFLLIFIKGWMIFLLWLICLTFLLWPSCKFYELLLVAQLRDSSVSETRMRLWARIQRLPMALRFGIFLALNLGSWWALMRWLDYPADAGFIVFGIIAAVHWVFTAVLFYGRRLRAHFGRRKATKRRETQTQDEPPPIPPPQAA